MKALIVDHEPQGRAVLRDLCEADGSIAEVTVAECGAAAIEMIHANHPDLLFLDVELKDMTGFDVLRSLKGPGRPAVIMVASHENHAFEAYRSGVIDYLTKPVGARHVATAIEKAHQRHDLRLASTPDQDSTRSNHGRRAQPPMLLMAESSHRLYFLEVEDIDYIESCGNYVLLHVGDQKFVRRDTIKRLATLLRDARFKWIRRSTLINLSRVAFAEKLEGGALTFSLKSGTRLVSKRRIRL
jgi:two-component system, LytTR family, response regulator